MNISRRSAGSSACPGRLGQGNRLPEPVCDQIVQLPLAQPEKPARQLACLFTDRESYFVSESGVFRPRKRFDLIESPAFQPVTAADRFAHPSRRVSELWQTDFSYSRIQGWGWYYRSTVLDDDSRYILARKQTPTMAATDVQHTLEIALAKAELDRVRARHRPRLFTDNGLCHVSGELRRFLEGKGWSTPAGRPVTR